MSIQTTIYPGQMLIEEWWIGARFLFYIQAIIHQNVNRSSPEPWNFCQKFIVPLHTRLDPALLMIAMFRVSQSSVTADHSIYEKVRDWSIELVEICIKNRHKNIIRWVGSQSFHTGEQFSSRYDLPEISWQVVVSFMTINRNYMYLQALK